MTSTSEVKPDIELCQCCLALDRKLTKLGNYAKLYGRLISTLSPKSRLSQNPVDLKEMLVCWECHSLLCKLNIFCQQVLEVQDFLIGMKDVKIEIKCYSKLTTTTKIGYDLDIIYNPILSKTDTDVTDGGDGDHIKSEKIDCVNKLDYEENENETLIKFEMCFTDDEHSKLSVDNPDDDDISLKSLKSYKNEVTTPKAKKKNNNITKPKKTRSKARCKIISLQECTADFKKNWYAKESVDQSEWLNWLEKERSLYKFTRRNYRCPDCMLVLNTEEAFTKHKEKFHSINSKFKCDTCGISLPTKSKIARHCRQHFRKYRCLMCGCYCHRKEQMIQHLDSMHEKLYVCLDCGMKFDVSERRSFDRHHRELHAKCICDECGKTYKDKTRLSNHIMRCHNPHFCKICKRSFVSYGSFKCHMKRMHVKEPSEATYCVECDIQFDNMIKYTHHLKGSLKHRLTSHRFSCPVCPKKFVKKSSLENHHNLVHLKKSKYCCDKCSRLFLNLYRLKYHMERVHYKIKPPKDKICPYCGKGFEVNKHLIHHIRTHTGERPYKCVHCPAAFAQKAPLVTHSKNIHKVVLSCSEIQFSVTS